MAELNEDSLCASGVYRSKDPITNFKIKVHLVKVSSSYPEPKSPSHELEEGEVEMRPLQGIGEVIDREEEEYTFQWQEKVFSQREINKYKHASSCETALERKYHDDVRRLIKKKKTTKRLFTYVDTDQFVDANEFTKAMTTASDDSSTFLANKMSQLRLRNISRRYIQSLDVQNKCDFAASTPKVNIVDEKPEPTMSQARRYLRMPTQTMVILADVAERDSIGEDASNEVVLCTIQATASGTVTIDPDFNYSRPAYRKVLDTDGKVCLYYSLDHASQAISKEELAKETEMYKEIYDRHVDRVQSAVGREFEMPAPGIVKVFVFGEIASACGFDASHLFINYHLQLPPNWSIVGTQQNTFGTTHICTTKADGRQDVAHFSTPFNFELLLDIRSIAEDMLPKWPQLLIEVWSQDFWHRYRVEGYSYVGLPSFPGVFEWLLPTWCPVSSTLHGRLWHFFLGCSSELDDTVFPTLPVHTEKVHPLSRLGLRTESRGSVKVKMNLVHQSYDYLSSESDSHSIKNILSRLGSLSVQSSILSVLEAFQRARQRMLAARNNLPVSESLQGSEAGFGQEAAG